MQYSTTSTQTGSRTLRPTLYSSALPSMIPAHIQNPDPSFTHYQSSHMSGSDAVSSPGRQADSRSLTLTYGRSNPFGTAAPSLSKFPISLQASTSPGDQNLGLRSSEPSSLYNAQSCGPGIIYMEFPMDTTPVHGDLQPSGTDRCHDQAAYDHTTSHNDQYFSGSPESAVYGDFGAGEPQAMWDVYESPESHAEPLPDNASTFAAPQLTSPANQRAAIARRKREAKYTCDMCGSSLTAKHNLNSHMNAHFGIKPFCCQVCKREYTAKSTFRRHMKTVHPDQE